MRPVSQHRPAHGTALRPTRREARYGPAARRRGPGFWFWRLVRWAFVLGILSVAAVLGLSWWVGRTTAPLVYGYDSPDLPPRQVAMVFGAGLRPSGSPSQILYDRIATAVDLYRAGRVEKLLMTGDNSQEDYNEVEAMRRTAVQLGVPDEDIVLDYAGFSTYESCYRGRDIFGVRGAILVTNRYHLPRALHLCASLGLDVVGVPSDRQGYRTGYYSLREIPALAASQLWLLLDRKPTFLGDPVDITVPQPRPTPAPDA